ncbi:uncharacterized protein LOC135976059 [Chrysemys picta bellii]|uniref:uncharacterized protein LOC135976059 n=1 Tax=Chrysemys picta bellii TaxID=8478 RepID=UPI0032B2B6FC
MRAGLWLLLAWVMFELSCPSAWPLPGATRAPTLAPARSLPWVPLSGLLPPVRVQRRAAWLEAMVRRDRGLLCPYGAVLLFVVDLAQFGAGPKGMPDFLVYTTTLSYSYLPAIRTSPGVVRIECCCPSSPPLVKGSGAVGKCCLDRNCGAFRGRSGRIQRKRHLPSRSGNSSEVETETDVTVGPSPSREAALRSRDQVEVVKMTAKGAMKYRGVALVLSGLAAAVSVLFLAGGALLARQRCSNVAV